MTVLSIDAETYSDTSIKHGLAKYFETAKLLMLAYQIDDSPVELWEPHKSEMPAELEQALNDENTTIVAWNAIFEWYVVNRLIGVSVPIARFKDTMINALSLSLPGKLSEVGPIVGLDIEHLKNPEGAALIRRFCVPTESNGKKVIRDYKTDPELWETFCEYCKQDVVAERAIAKKLAIFDLSEQEWSDWHLDQKINLRGAPVDVELVDAALALDAEEKTRLLDELKTRTQLANPVSVTQFLAYAKQQGYSYDSLSKECVSKYLDQHPDTELAETLKIRQQATKTSVKKYEALKTATHNGRLKHTLQFYGARTGRWAGRIFQPQNLPSATFDDIDTAIELIKARDADTIDCLYDSVTEVLSGCIRAAIRAEPGNTLVVADLSAIENRVLAWIADDAEMLNIFETGLDPYKKFAVEMFGKKYEEITKKERKLAKPPVLGCGYMLGAKGLQKYSEGYGITIDETEAKRQVELFRSLFSDVPRFWKSLETAFFECVLDKNTVALGKLEIVSNPPVVQIVLPSGRAISYIRPAIQNLDTPWGEKRPQITYEGFDLKRKWTRIPTHPGKLTENVVQAIARDVLLEGIKRAENAGFNVVLHVHDEIVAEVPKDSGLTHEKLAALMSKPIVWAEGLPLAAEGFTSDYYKKD
ncbi:MAG: hypothetical protein D6711_19175 [Chloroflexi bacterium]|nr:MAG: hypothetical protein D6711_19175 [Chloroflexota bacterium]